MTAIQRDIIIDQGATWREAMTWCYAGPPDASGRPTAGAPRDLTGATARMQIRDTPDAAPPRISLTDSDGITLGGLAGTIELLISADQSAAIGPLRRPLRCGYDLEVTAADGQVTRLLEGAVLIRPNVTR